jgi:hypothetical protein
VNVLHVTLPVEPVLDQVTTNVLLVTNQDISNLLIVLIHVLLLPAMPKITSPVLVLESVPLVITLVENVLVQMLEIVSSVMLVGIY